ncbi:flavodoxin domain-containing protein [Teredinibacter sp. KSP-S5-2]|uniref:flavodoxin domain-containing protein n=1 Tax=Teredinibacter sp. KSP-S5-2 TaxID=3034506 RepID=UPI002934FF13|nr:flavodoxin domain-containing protein [Teredinibacter sp. KSP-S5-2]WNO11586.1 flavodoxin domain-containing protein [Teredinibacter sp. KSP-S5-2]
MANVQIIVGSVMGTALEVARTIEAVLEGYGHHVALNPAFQAGDLGDDPDQLLIICTSNTGMGDLPENIQPFHQHLVNDIPQVVDRRYVIVNLGDSSYPQFAQAGQTIDEALADIGAKRISTPLVIDAMEVDDHEDVAASWATELNEII